MKKHLTETLICPACLPGEMTLALEAHESRGIEVITGVLRCSRCPATYPITDGMASILPQPQQVTPGAKSKYEKTEVVSSYLWSHYADLFADEEATRAYSEWADQILPGTGFALDAGCAVGRFAFELSQKCDFVIGFDTSRGFIAQARKLLIERQLDFALKQEGYLSERRTIKLPNFWDASKVDFIVVDAQALPFRSNFFSCVASLNLVDKLSKPLVHLREISRAAREVGAQFLFSDPFSWSAEHANEQDWLGGSERGVYAGWGRDNVQAILEGRTGEISPPWMVQERGNVWWKIRNHRNHFELIRSCFLKVIR